MTNDLYQRFRTRPEQTRPRVLYYSETHPIRNAFTEHVMVCRLLGRVLARFAHAGQIDLRIFGNRQFVEKVRAELPGVAPFLSEPTPAEDLQISSYIDRWDEERIAQWLDLVRGEGEVTGFYRSILARLHREQPIDLVILWSENGAVRRFCDEMGIPVLHGELGPTRPPFAETVMFDPSGTNGNAALRRLAESEIRSTPAEALHPPATWLLPTERRLEAAETTSSLIDLPMTYQSAYADLLGPSPYVFVAMQLADDLNMLMHSPYASPLEFLDEAVREIHANGYRAVVKGHPGALARSYNLRKELEAFHHVRQAYPEVEILPRSTNVSRSLFTLAHATYSMSINSSVSFESLLLGVPSVLKGAASFDANGYMQSSITLMPEDRRPDYRTILEQITSVHLGRHFLPKPVLLETDYLLWLIYETVGLQDRRPALAFDAWYLLGRLAEQDTLSFQDFEAQVTLGGQTLHGAIRVKSLDGEVRVQSYGESVTLSLEENGFIGNIDAIVPRDGYLELSGWCLDRAGTRAPEAILLLFGDLVLPIDRITVPRYDVHQARPSAGEEALRSGFTFRIPERFGRPCAMLLVSASGTCAFVDLDLPGGETAIGEAGERGLRGQVHRATDALQRRLAHVRAKAPDRTR